MKQAKQDLADDSAGYRLLGDLDRISKVEKNILRIGVFELCMTDDVPLKVAIAEAVRLARKFASPEGASYVNAVLDAISKGEECISKKEESSVS